MELNKKTASLTAITVGALIALSGCKSGGAKSDNHIKNFGPNNKENISASNANDNTLFTYWFIRNGCSTQKQVFQSLNEMCSGLQDKALNKGCALDLRKQEYKKVGCTGEFNERVDGVEESHTNTKTIRCTGKVSGYSGEKIIDETIEWNGANFQKVILSDFKDLDSAGEYSVNLIPNENRAEPGLIEIFGWFIDANKNQRTVGSEDSVVSFSHRDPKYQNRDVQIVCAKDEERKSSVYSQKSSLEISCIGGIKDRTGQDRNIGTHIKWDQQNPVTKEISFLNNNKNERTNVFFDIELDKKTGLYTTKLRTKGLDGHVTMFSEITGEPEAKLEYISAWDVRTVKIHCLPTQKLQASIESLIKEMNEKKKKSDESNK